MQEMECTAFMQLLGMDLVQFELFDDGVDDRGSYLPVLQLLVGSSLVSFLTKQLTLHQHLVL